MEANSIGDHVHSERPQQQQHTHIATPNGRISKGSRKSKKMVKKRCVCCQGPKNDLQEKADSQQKRCNQLLERICALQLNILNKHLVKQYDSFLDHVDPNGGVAKSSSSLQLSSPTAARGSVVTDVGGIANRHDDAVAESVNSCSSATVTVNNNNDNTTCTATTVTTDPKDVSKSSPARPGPSTTGGMLDRSEDVKLLQENGCESKDGLSYDGPSNQSDLIVLQRMLEKCESAATNTTSFGTNDGVRSTNYSRESSLLENLLRDKTKEQKDIQEIKNRILQTRKSLSAASDSNQGPVGWSTSGGGSSSVLDNVMSTTVSVSSPSLRKNAEDDVRLSKMIDAYSEKVASETDWLSVSMNQSLRETMRPSQNWDETDSSCGDESCDDEFMPKATESNTTKFPYLPTVHNPGTSWAAARAAVVTSWLWNCDAIANASFRLEQQEQVQRHLKSTKPPFQWEDKPVPGVISPNVNNASTNLQPAYIQIHYPNDVPAASPKTPKPNYPNGHRPPNQWSEPLGKAIKPISLKEPIVIGEESDPLVNGVDNKSMGGKVHPNPSSCDKLNNVGGGLESLGIKVRSESDSSSCVARRCLALKPYRPRKIFQLGGVHKMSQPPKKPSLMCNCFGRKELCALCTGRLQKVRSLESDFEDQRELPGVLEPSYHRSLAMPEEMPLQLILDASLESETWKESPALVPELIGEALPEEPDIEEEEEVEEEIIDVEQPQPPKRKRGRPKMKSPSYSERRHSTVSSRRIKRRRIDSDYIDDGDTEEESDDDEDFYVYDADAISPTGKYSAKKVAGASEPQSRRRRDEKYDIDNIVIPYSIASTTRVEKIEYKEIQTPSWRVVRNGYRMVSLQELSQNGLTDGTNGWDENEVEDLSLEVIQARHERSEIEEHRKFRLATKKSNRRSRRMDSKADYSEPHTPDPMSPNPELLDGVPPPSPNIISPAAPPKFKPFVPIPHHQIQIPVVTEAVATLAASALKMSSYHNTRRRTMSSANSMDGDFNFDHHEKTGYTPWEPRTFPLTDDEYGLMRAQMSEDFLKLCDADELPDDENG